MISIFKKVEKSRENLIGIQKIEDINKLDKPFLLCLSAQDFHDKSVYGIVKIGAQAARVDTTEEMAAGYKIDEFPVDFLGVKYNAEHDYLKELKILKELVIPYLFNSEDKSVEYLEKRARNINFMTYCDGVINYIKFEDLLIRELNRLGYTTEEINRIVSQISLTAIGTSIDTDKLLATNVRIIDINDSEIFDESFSKVKDELIENQSSSICKQDKDNSISYYYEGTGEHEVREYLKDEAIVKPVLCSVISYFLDKSVRNNKEENVVKINIDELKERIVLYGDESFSSKKKLEFLDKQEMYGNAEKYTESESKLRKELDDSYKLLYISAKNLKAKTKSNSENEQKVRKLVETIKLYSSDTTFKQIMSNLKMWNVVGDYSKIPSDKEVRKQYESALNKAKNK